jgi:hypothetical protein
MMMADRRDATSVGQKNIVFGYVKILMPRPDGEAAGIADLASLAIFKVLGALVCAVA